MFGTEEVAGDQCGPFAFDAVVKTPPLRVSLGQELTFLPPAAWAFSVKDTSLPTGWSVLVAPASGLAVVEDGTATGIPETLGQAVAAGVGPDIAVTVKAPTKAGDYVLQLAGPIARDGWTILGNLYYWRITVA
jgi:hypothetical protein